MYIVMLVRRHAICLAPLTIRVLTWLINFLYLLTQRTMAVAVKWTSDIILYISNIIVQRAFPKGKLPFLAI